MADVFSVQGSLPDQLPIIETISTQTSESNKALPPFIRLKKRKSTKLQNIMKPKRSVRPRYFSAGVKITDQNVRDFTKGSSPFEYFIGLEAFAHSVMIKAWRNDVRIKELQKNLHERPSYKDRHKKDLLNRLYVKEPRIIGGKSVLTINPNYYSIVGGEFCFYCFKKIASLMYISLIFC